MTQNKKTGVAAAVLIVVLIALVRIAPFFMTGETIESESQEAAAHEVRVTSESRTEVNEKSDEDRLSEFKSANPDVVAMVRIDGTQIDSPVVQNPDSEYYLRRGLDGNYNLYGVPFLQNGCDISGNANLIIYGHSSYNHQAFGDLSELQKQEFLDGHDTVVLTTSHGSEKWKIFAFCVFPIRDGDFVYNSYTVFGSETDWNVFMGKVKKASTVECDTQPQYGDRIMMLTSCYSEKTPDLRTVVLAYPER